MKQLKNLADIKLGLAFKSAIIDDQEKGTCYLLQPKDITLESQTYLDSLTQVVPESNPKAHYLKQDDVILRLRGPNFSAAIVYKELSLPIVATNQCAIIRCNRELLSPYYLLWFLNSNLGQSALKSFSEGTNINKLSAKIVESLELDLPTLENQIKIEKIHRNWLDQKTIHTKLIDIGNQFFDKVCLNIHSGNTENDSD